MPGQPLIENDQILDLSADKLTSGTVPAARLTGTYNIDISGTANNANSLGGSAAALYALLASPAFTGTPTAPTPSGSPATDQIVNVDFLEQYVANRGFTEVSVLTGTVAHGGTIPLPSGYIQAQCAWTVGAGTWPPNQFGGWSRDGIDNFVVQVNSSRVVSAYTTNGPTFLATSANYIIVGVK